MGEDTQDFVKMCFKGARFDLEFIPVDALPAVHKYQDLLLKIAKEIWKEENPDKQNLPKNFNRLFELGLRGVITTKSKVVSLPRKPVDPDLFGNTSFDYVFAEAQEKLSAALVAANQNTHISPLPESSLASLKTISRTIKPGEYIDVFPKSSASGEKSFRISEKSIQKIIDASLRRENKALRGHGFVSGISENPSSVRITSSFGAFNYEIDWAILRSDPKYHMGSVVYFDIFAEVDNSSTIRRTIRNNALSSATITPKGQELQARIKGISEIQEGWLDGKGKRPSHKTVMRSLDIAQFLSLKYPEVSVFIEDSGEVDFEWTTGSLAASLLVGDDVFLLGVSDLESDKFREKSFNGISSVLLRQIENVELFLRRWMPSK
ncbi:hypothetical protein [Roseibaca sp. Y0-43]|uniref:hypothetical protein n=1 Tax=Roseibaca sp. Y0-43 TaxID=2816854 RepID=UPI001D0C3A03|nr:hypothetical protein [Roseibaca sp. Y0-43]MCC1482106.1 hypothetical protein [Roseibaca sp. Y0-43]